MDAKTAIQAAMDMSSLVLNRYIEDMSDDDLLRRPAAGCNHLAWQLGHLISSEVQLLSGICPGRAAELPSGFAEAHNKENAACDDRSKFCTKQQYLDVWGKVRAATIGALNSLSDSDLDGPSPEWIRQHFSSVGQVFTLIATHPLMHSGQFAVVRRLLGKPIVI